MATSNISAAEVAVLACRADFFTADQICAAFDAAKTVEDFLAAAKMPSLAQAFVNLGKNDERHFKAQKNLSRIGVAQFRAGKRVGAI